jgi:hypothetical protein
MHLIRFPTRKEHKRGLLALLEVPGEFLGLPDYQMVVTEEQVRALEQANVTFEYLSKTAPNGTSGTPLQP